MKYIIKRNIVLFGNNNIIKFGYNVKINDSKNGFENFDIGNEEEAIDELLNKLDSNLIARLNEMAPIYISLSSYLFNNLAKLCAIEYEANYAISKITRQDLINNH